MVAEVAILLAAERSGTHMLRSMLTNVPHVRAPGEVCNAMSEGAESGKFSFFRFREKQCLADRDHFYPTPKAQYRLLNLYFDDIRRQATGIRLVLLDVKYPHIHNFNGFWWDYDQPPNLLGYARNRKVKVVHLVRKKVYRTAISQIYANASGIFRSEHPDEVPQIRMAIPRATLETRALRLAKTVRLFDEWLADCRHIRVTYEALTENSEATLQNLSDFLSLRRTIPAISDYVRITPPYEQAISNYAEIADLIDLSVADVAEGPRRPRLGKGNGVKIRGGENPVAESDAGGTQIHFGKQVSG